MTHVDTVCHIGCHREITKRSADNIVHLKIERERETFYVQMKSWHYPLRKNHSWMLISIILVVVSKIVNGFQLRKGKPNLMDRPARNFPLPGPDGPDEYNPESFPKWMKPKVDDDTDQGGSIANRESPNRYHKPLVQLSPIESEGAKAVYSGNFFGNGKKPVMYTPDVPNGGNDALAHMLFAPAPHKVLPGGGIAADHLKEGGKMGVGPAAVSINRNK